jgi:uncharacterized membrane protein YuzA (DUF378 family)
MSPISRLIYLLFGVAALLELEAVSDSESVQAFIRTGQVRI